MDVDLNGRPVIVTGAAQGIGRVIAIEAARCGARVGVFDRNGEGAEAVAKEIRDFGWWAAPYAVDLTKVADTESAVGRFEDEAGHVYGVVNNAAVQGLERVPFWEVPEPIWYETISGNLYLVFTVCRAIIPGMLERRRGSIVNIVSDAGRVGEPREAVYSAAKAGVIGLSRAIARDLGRAEVRVNCVSPAATRSPFSEPGFTPERLPRMMKRYQIQRVGEPEDVAGAVLFLLSDEASYITGQTLSVNGGFYYG